MTLGDLLRSEGYTVDFAVDGDAGFEKATNLPYDVIILGDFSGIVLPGTRPRRERQQGCARDQRGENRRPPRPDARAFMSPETIPRSFRGCCNGVVNPRSRARV